MSVIPLKKDWWKEDRKPERRPILLLNLEDIPALRTAPKLMSVKAVAQLLDFSAYSVSEWCREGVIAATKVRGRWRIPRESLIIFFSKRA